MRVGPSKYRTDNYNIGVGIIPSQRGHEKSGVLDYDGPELRLIHDGWTINGWYQEWIMNDVREITRRHGGPNIR